MSTEAKVDAKHEVYRERANCRACGARGTLESILDLGDLYLPRWTATRDDDLPHAPLDFARCTICGLLQLRHSVDPDLLYREFWYRSGINDSMRAALRDLVADAAQYHDRGAWLDIGANDGYLLSQVPQDFVRVACEPARNFQAELEELCEVAVMDYFPSENSALDGPFEVITSAACFYDVSDPARFVEGIARALAPDGIWINQLNDAPGMMRQNAFDSICHEHVAYYSVPDLERLYAAHGLVITQVSFNDVNGGSVRVTAQHRGAAVPTDLLGLARVTREEALSFAARTRRWKQRMNEVLAGLCGGQGAIYGAGASTKGATLLQYLQPGKSIAAIGDRNHRKHGTVTAGSWIPVVSEEEMRAAKPRALLVLPWAFKHEIAAREAALIESGTAMVLPLPTIEVLV